MRSHSGSSWFAVAVVSALLLWAPSGAAKDLNGRLGVGVEHSLSGVSGATLRYWPAAAIGLGFAIGADVVGIAQGKDPATQVDGAITLLYNPPFARSLHANLGLGLRVAASFSSVPVTTLADDGTEITSVDSRTGLRIEIPIVLEFFLSDNLSISAGTGAGVAFRLDAPDVQVNVATASISATFGMVYYF